MLLKLAPVTTLQGHTSNATNKRAARTHAALLVPSRKETHTSVRPDTQDVRLQSALQDIAAAIRELATDPTSRRSPTYPGARHSGGALHEAPVVRLLEPPEVRHAGVDPVAPPGATIAPTSRLSPKSLVVECEIRLNTGVGQDPSSRGVLPHGAKCTLHREAMRDGPALADSEGCACVRLVGRRSTVT